MAEGGWLLVLGAAAFGLAWLVDRLWGRRPRRHRCPLCGGRGEDCYYCEGTGEV